MSILKASFLKAIERVNDMTHPIEVQRHLYPVYLVHDKYSGHESVRVRQFKLSDPRYQNPGLFLPPTDYPIEFLAYTEDQSLTMEITYEVLADSNSGDLILLFDPDSSRRKMHNAFRFRIPDGGPLCYEEYRYELEVVPIPHGAALERRVENGFYKLRLSFPLALLKLDLPDKRTVGFNLIRTIALGNQEPAVGWANVETAVAWAAVQGDKSVLGQGTGDLLFTSGLTPVEMAEQAEKIASESDVYFTRWEVKKVPSELYAFMKQKQRGHQ
jgi:hypothetical protein